jgi:predicted esterase
MRTLLPVLLLLGLVLVAVPPRGVRAEAEDVADVPAETIVIGEDENKRYVRIGPVEGAKRPSGGHPLLVILPGGDGGEGFGPFCRRILKHACPKGWVAAQVIAPKWSEEQRIVWPTEQLEVEGMEFSTADLVDAVIEDASEWTKIDDDEIHVLGWSSSGPAIWELSARKKTPVKRYFIAMSVFKKDRLPSRPPTRGRSWYLLHSPNDRVCPIRLAREGEAWLEKANARVKFQEYAGGHGWRGNVYGMIREGLDWLGED